MRHAREENRVHAAGIRHEAGAVGAQRGAKLFQLVDGHGSKLAFFDVLVEPHKNAIVLDAGGFFDGLYPI